MAAEVQAMCRQPRLWWAADAMPCRLCCCFEQDHNSAVHYTGLHTFAAGGIVCQQKWLHACPGQFKAYICLTRCLHMPCCPPRAGVKGRRIRELTSIVQKRFKFPEGSVELYAEKVGCMGRLLAICGRRACACEQRGGV